MADLVGIVGVDDPAGGIPDPDAQQMRIGQHELLRKAGPPVACAWARGIGQLVAFRWRPSTPCTTTAISSAC